MMKPVSGIRAAARRHDVSARGRESQQILVSAPKALHTISQFTFIEGGDSLRSDRVLALDLDRARTG
jgi:hypothetical protein